MNKHPVLSVQDLSIAFKTNTKYKTVVKSVSFDLLPRFITVGPIFLNNIYFIQILIKVTFHQLYCF